MQVIDNEGIRCVPQPTCVSCGANGRIIHEGLRDLLYGAPGVWRTRRCLQPDCGLAWLDPQPLPEEQAKLGDRHEASEAAERAAGESAVAAGRERYVSRGFVAFAKQALRRLWWWRRFWFDTDYVFLGSGAPGRLLDVQCGSGDYLRSAAGAGWGVVGLDDDPAAVAAVRAAGFEAIVGDFLAVELPDASFDAVTMRNTLGDLPDPKAVFAKAHRILRPGGRLVVMTPNAEAYCHYAYGADWRGLDVPHSRYLYSAQTLRRLAKRAGFGHREAFSQFRNERGVRFMTDQSERIAALSGGHHRRPDAAYLGRKAALRAWLGIARGEYVHLVAEK